MMAKVDSVSSLRAQDGVCCVEGGTTPQTKGLTLESALALVCHFCGGEAQAVCLCFAGGGLLRRLIQPRSFRKPCDKDENCRLKKCVAKGARQGCSV